jgi:GDP-L-fucose synthase
LTVRIAVDAMGGDRAPTAQVLGALDVRRRGGIEVVLVGDPARIRPLLPRRGAPEVVAWGTGSPRREYLHGDDLAAACIHLLKTYDDAIPLNVGTGEDISIKELAEMISDITGFKGQLSWDTTKPDGTAQKLLDVSRINATGWKAKIDVPTGLQSTYQWYLENIATARN